MRSSSLSSHAGGCLDRRVVSSSSDTVAGAGTSSAEAPMSAKKSWQTFSKLSRNNDVD